MLKSFPTSSFLAGSLLGDSGYLNDFLASLRCMPFEIGASPHRKWDIAQQTAVILGAQEEDPKVMVIRPCKQKLLVDG